MDRISAGILGFGLPAIFLVVVYAAAGSVYETRNVTPPRFAPETEASADAEEASADEAGSGGGQEMAADTASEETDAEAGTPEDGGEETGASEEVADAAPAAETEGGDAAADASASAETAQTDTTDTGTTQPANADGAEAQSETAEATDGAEREAPAGTETADAAEDASGETAEATEGEATEAEAPAEASIDLAAIVEAGDVRAGERIWRQCSACHVVDQEQNRVGPHLVDVIGRERASVEGFRYSDALSGMGGVWTPEEMDAWLESPRDYAPGTSMSFRGLSDPEDRANVLAYIADQQQSQ